MGDFGQVAVSNLPKIDSSPSKALDFFFAKHPTYSPPESPRIPPDPPGSPRIPPDPPGSPGPKKGRVTIGA